MAAVMSQLTNPLAPPPAASRLLLSGNEAVARAVWESGVRVAAAYPGTPATEIIESVARYPDLYAEWSVNEKVSMEVALGASMTGMTNDRGQCRIRFPRPGLKARTGVIDDM